ncbi:MAG TPA: hypothetical protein VE404_04700 [Verrucomicrobiae bacterium]|nr:hypothetical protein [Verrucomicrobiae bacterium]
MTPHRIAHTSIAILLAVAASGAAATSAARTLPTLADLPLKLETKIPAVLEDQLADVERAASALPRMDRKRAYLLTLPLQNYLEDVVLSGGRPARVHPRALAWVIGREAAHGTPAKEISRLLVTYFQKDLFKTLDIEPHDVSATEASKGGNP